MKSCSVHPVDERGTDPVAHPRRAKFVDAKALSSWLSPAADEMEAPAKTPEPNMEVHNINIVLVLVYVVKVLFDKDKDMRRSTLLWALAWLVGGVVVAMFEVVILVSIIISNNWQGCTEQDDCPIGEECGHTIIATGAAAGTLTRALCLDCVFLSDEHSVLPMTPWKTVQVGEPDTNLSSACNELLLDVPTRHYFHFGMNSDSTKGRMYDSTIHKYDTNYTELFDTGSCMYARKHWQQMSPLENMVLPGTFLLIALDLAADAREMNRTSFLRRKVLGWRAPSRAAGASPMYFRLLTLLRLLVDSLVKFVDVVLMKIVPALIPPGLLMLLVSQGMDSTSILLNGLSITFVLHLDSAIPAVFLTNTERHEILRYFSAIAKRVDGISFAGQVTQLQTSRPFESPVRLLSSMVAFTIPFFFVTGIGTGVHCETIVYYVYYRAGITFSLWVPWAARELFELIARAIALVELHAKDAATARRQVKPELMEFAANVAVRFVETLACAVLMNCTFGLFCEFFWNVDWERFFDLFFFGFVKDIFGACAAGGYMDEFGFECVWWSLD